MTMKQLRNNEKIERNTLLAEINSPELRYNNNGSDSDDDVDNIFNDN